MINRTTKLRWRRRVRRSRQQVENIGEQAEHHLEQHVIKRLNRMWFVRRFILTWILLITIVMATLLAQVRGLSQYYQTMQPIPGGIYTEGILGTFTNANPLYATGAVDSSISSLVFSGLFKYSQDNVLIGDLAQKWQVNERGNEYTVTLRENLKWHDGQPVTAGDVVFTYNTIQNPDAKSPLFNSWKGVKVLATDKRTIRFTLPTALSSFPYAMTNGIVPQHLLSGVPATRLRSVAFNTTHPIGAGPFKWKTIEVSGSTPETREERVALTANTEYAWGAPKLDGFIVRAFHDQNAMISSFERRELHGMAGLDEIPGQLSKHGSSFKAYNMPLTSQTMLFFRNTNEILADVRVRKALVQSVDTKKVLSKLGFPAQTVKEPLLKTQTGYDPALTQLPYDIVAAKKLLDDAGWKADASGKRTKDGKPFTFRLFSENTPEYNRVVDEIEKQWKAIGLAVEFIPPMPTSDLQEIVRLHTYDALLYGISLGVDPDVFAYWHSSQGDVLAPNRLNFSEYKSVPADRALEAGRTRSDAQLRALKYRPFLEAWRNDAPALGLYQPRYLYITRESLNGFKEHTLNTGIDRYSGIENWTVRKTEVNNP